MDGSVKIQQLLAFPPFVETNRNSERTCFLIGACSLPLKRNLQINSKLNANVPQQPNMGSMVCSIRLTIFEKVRECNTCCTFETDFSTRHCNSLSNWNQKTSNNKLHRTPHRTPPPPPSRRTPDARLLHRPARVSIQDPLLKSPPGFPGKFPASSATATVAFSTACWGKFLEQTKKPGTMETPTKAGSVNCSSCIFVRARLNYFSMIFHPSVKRILTKACKPPFDKFMNAQLHTFFLTSCMTGVSSLDGVLDFSFICAFSTRARHIRQGNLG